MSPRPRRSRSVCCVLVSLFALTAQAQTNTYIGPPVGDWNDAANWSLGVVPDESSRVRIDDQAAQTSLVQIGSGENFSTDELRIDAGDTLDITGSGELNTGPIENSGSIQVGSTTGSTPRLLAQHAVFNLPTGRIALDAGVLVPLAPDHLFLWNQGTMEGRGLVFTSSLRNEHLIDANLVNEALIIRGPFTRCCGPPTGNLTNSGDLRSSGGGWLSLQSWGNQGLQNFDGETPGTIEAQGDSYVFIENTQVVGGRITTSTTDGVQEGRIEFQREVSLVGVELDANASFWQGSTLYDSTIANLATIHLSAQDFQIRGDVTLSGGGIVEMAGSPRMTGANTSSIHPLNRLINVDNTIRAKANAMGPNIFGQLGHNMLVENHGTFEAEGSRARLVLDLTGTNELEEGQPAWKNRGVMRAVGGGTLVLHGHTDRPLDNEGGVIEVDSISRLDLDQSHVVGGTIRGPSTAPLGGNSNFSGQTLLEGVRLEGVVTMDQPMMLAGTIENTGSFSAQQGIQLASSEVTLVGGGEISLEHVDSNFFNNLPPALVNVDNTVLLTGLTAFNSVRLVNRGTLEANQSGQSAFEIFPASATSQTINSGVIRAVDGAHLDILSGGVAIQNYELDSLGNVVPGVIQAGVDSQVQVRSVDGGVLQAATGGEIQLKPNARLSGSAEAGELRLIGLIAAEGSFQLGGTIRNDGVLQTDGAINDNWELEVSPHLRLLGKGKLRIGRLASQPLNSSLINGSEHTVTNYDQTSEILTYGNLVINEGRIEAREGKTMSIGHRGSELLFQQLGELVATGGGQLHWGPQFGTGPLPRLANDGLIESQTASTVVIQVDDQFTNRGTLRIEPDATMTIVGHLAQAKTSVLEIELGESSFFTAEPSLTATTAELDGLLRITLADLGDELFTPQLNDSFLLLETDMALAPIDGAFNAYSLPTLDDGLVWNLRSDAHRVTLSVIAELLADLDGDNDVDGNDLLLIQRTDPSLITQWHSEFGSTVIVSNAGAFAAVPEPASAALLVFALIACSCRVFHFR